MSAAFSALTAALRGALGEHRIYFICDEETLFGIEPEIALGRGDFLRSERRAVHIGGAGLAGRTLADHGRRDDEDRSVLGLQRLAVGAVDLVEIMAVALEDLPAVRLKALLDVITVGVKDIALDLDAVEIVDERKSREFQRARHRSGLVADALLHVAVAAENPGAVGAVLHLRADGEPDAHGDTLSERTRRHFNARHDTALGVTGAARTELAE